MIYEHQGVFAIDTFMHGWEGITAVYYLPGPSPTLIETGPATSLEPVLEGLEKLDVQHLDLIVVTHIHLDHAGAAGHLAERFPEATVVVREEGAPHLADPSRLWASASRLYPDMEALWGEMRPIAEERIRAIGGDGLIAQTPDGLRLEAIYSPGHARHHMAVLERSRGDLFAGDAIGVYLPDAGVIRPATPPPDFDPEITIDSIEKLRSVRPSRLFPTHFGLVPDVNEAFTEATRRIREWGAAAEQVFERGGDVADIAEEFEGRRGEFYPGLDPSLVEKFENTTSYNLNASGFFRYLTKRREKD
jgi:glyoxylase-like metal-dependent hydrolase (beta-lactamase superfamily II)